MGEIHVSCKEVVELVSDYIEQALPPHEASLFEQHLNFCEGCVIYVEQLRSAVRTAERVQESEVPPEVRDKLLGAFRDWRAS